MNYYIQGDVANADKIKAAFEKLGYDTTGHLFNAKSVLYFTLDGGIMATTCNCTPAIIKTHPDYKELELPIESKFKVGDWVVRGRGFVYEPSLITEIRDYYVCELLNGERVTYALNDVHKNFHLWTIADAKDGDVICTANSNLFIYKCKGIGVQIYDYCGLYHGKFEPDSSSPNGVYNSCDAYVPATKEERGLFFAKMREAGYQWDADKKELRKIQHYDIASFKPFDKVLIRVGNKSKWTCDFFSYYDKGFHCIGTDDWSQCIPFNKDTEHLLGTTDMCGEEFINW